VRLTQTHNHTDINEVMNSSEDRRDENPVNIDSACDLLSVSAQETEHNLIFKQGTEAIWPVNKD